MDWRPASATGKKRFGRGAGCKKWGCAVRNGKPKVSELYSVVGMPRAHIAAVYSDPFIISTRCGLTLFPWRGPDGKPICQHCLASWRKGGES